MIKNNIETDKQIIDALTFLASYEESKGSNLSAISLIEENLERVLEIYKVNNVATSLVHNILLNPEVAHFFTVCFEEVYELWKNEDIQRVFAKAIMQGDSLLSSSITTLRGYRNIPLIQEALAYNISTAKSFIFQIVVASSAELLEYSEIKKAILARKPDIIKSIKKHWHESALISWVPYLMEDEEVKEVILSFKPLILREIREEERIADVWMLLENVEWIQEDSDILKELSDRIANRNRVYDRSLVRNVRMSNLYHRYPVLQTAVDNWER